MRTRQISSFFHDFPGFPLVKTGVGVYNKSRIRHTLSRPRRARTEKGLPMERRGASNTEEQELNQRRRLLNLARKGDPKAITRLFDLYQVRIYSGESLNKLGRLPFKPIPYRNTTPARVRKRIVRKPAPARRRTMTTSRVVSRGRTARAARRSSRRSAHR